MSFDYGCNDRDRDRDHSDRRGGYNNDREGGYSGAGRTAVHDSYERDRQYAREAGYDERAGSGEETRSGGYGGSYGNDEGSGEYNNRSTRGSGGYGNDERTTNDYDSSSYNRRNEREERGDYGSREYGSNISNNNNNNDRSGSGYQEEHYSGERNRSWDYVSNERHGNNYGSAAYYNNNSRDSRTGEVGLSGGGGGGKSGSGAVDWQAVGTQVAVAGIQHFTKSYDKASNINDEEQRRYDGADGAGGSQAKESAFAKKLGERQGDGARLGNEAGDLKDQLVEGGLGFLRAVGGGD